MGNAIGGIFALLAMLVAAINILGPFVAGIWLGFLGEWALIGFGVGYMIVGAMVVSLLLLPGLALVAAAAALEVRGNRVGALLASVPALLWTYAVVLGTSVLIMNFIGESIPRYENAIPYLLWGIVVAAAPWSFLAAKDAQAGNSDGYSSMTALFLFIGCTVASIWFYLEGANGWQDWAVRLGIVLGASLVLQLFLVSWTVLTRPRWLD